MSPVAPKAIVIYSGLDPLTLVKPASPVSPPAIASLDSLSGLSDSGGRFVITTESVHCPHLPGFVRSDVESCHGRIEQISPQRNSSCAHLPL
jgi:hypothetical protein